jgi:hypothetical protein
MAQGRRTKTSRTLARSLAVVTALSLVGLTACGSSFDGRTFHGDGFTLRVAPTPASWTPLKVSDASLAYEDQASGGTVGVNGRCDRDGEDVPLKALTQHLFIQFTEREERSQEVVPFDGREAMRSDMTAKLDGVPRRLVVWVMKKDKCVFDLMFIAPPDRFEAGVGAFDAWVKGFGASRDGGDP